MAEDQKRHCWECLRRRLVCDFQVPGCKRCAASEVECPGYGKTPPLRVKWLVPGKVKSRQGKGAGTNRQNKGRAGLEIASSESSRGRSASSDDTQEVVIPRFELKTEFHALVESLEYFNTCMYPRLSRVLRLGPNINIYKISPALFQMGLTSPAHIRLALVGMALSHRMIQTADDPDSKALEKTFYSYRGHMIRSLNDDINVEKKRNSNLALVGILTLLLLDAQRGISRHWRYHIAGAQRLITLRGGMREVIESPGVPPIILCFIFLVVTADTSSPASDLFVENLHTDEVYLLLKQYGDNGYAFQMCPPPLFAEVIKINLIRARASKAGLLGENDLWREACEVLRRIYGFSSEEWAEANERFDTDSKLSINILQSAVALYCISSLGSLGVLPPDPSLKNNCYMETRILHGLLSMALNPRSSFGTNGYVLWPLVVLGVQAVDGGADMRTFVREHLVNLSTVSGTYGPLAAKEVLESFWASGKTEWDTCFDKPYMFTNILTVNRGLLTRRVED